MGKQRKTNLFNRTMRELPSLEEVFGSKEAIPQAPTPAAAPGPTYLEWKAGIKKEWEDRLDALGDLEAEKETLEATDRELAEKTIALHRVTPELSEKVDRLAALSGKEEGALSGKIEVDFQALLGMEENVALRHEHDEISAQLAELGAQKASLKEKENTRNAILEEREVTLQYLASIERGAPVDKARNQYQIFRKLHKDVKDRTFPQPTAQEKYEAWKEGIQKEGAERLARLEAEHEKEKEVLGERIMDLEEQLVALQKKSPDIAKKLEDLDVLLDDDERDDEYWRLENQIAKDFDDLQEHDPEIKREVEDIKRQLEVLEVREETVDKRFDAAQKELAEKQRITGLYLRALESGDPISKKWSRDPNLHQDIRQGNFPRPPAVELEDVKASHEKKVMFADGLNNREKRMSEPSLKPLDEEVYFKRRQDGRPSKYAKSKGQLRAKEGKEEPTELYTPLTDATGKQSWQQYVSPNKRKTAQELAKKPEMINPAEGILKGEFPLPSSGQAR